MYMRVLLTVLAACKSGGSTFDEVAFVEKELATLRTALSAGDEPGVAVGCISVTTGLERMPPAVATEIAQLCGVEAPRLHLKNAIAGVRARRTSDPQLSDLSCTQLFVSDALEAIARHRSTDPELQRLVDEYAGLCPAQVTKLRGR